jgi:predicted esterase
LDNSTFVWNEPERGVRDVQQQYDAVQQEYSVDLSRLVIGGFSMGGYAALALALKGIIPARGVIAVAGAFGSDPVSDFPLDSLPEQPPRVYLIVGERDVRFYEHTLALAEYLTANDIECELSVYPDLAHTYRPILATR